MPAVKGQSFKGISLGVVFAMALAASLASPRDIEAAGSSQVLKRVGVLCSAGLVALLGGYAGLRHYEKVDRQHWADRTAAYQTYSTNRWKGYYRIHGGRLTPLWAQEYIGSDLVRGELRGTDFPPVGIGMIDEGVNSSLFPKERRTGYRKTVFGAVESLSEGAPGHGTAVASLILGDDVGVSEKARLEEVSDSVRANLFQSSIVRVVNFSVVFKDIPDELLDYFHILKNQNRILVFAVGNKSHLGILKPLYERFRPRPSNAGRQFPGIIVGSTNPEGDISAFSMGGEDVDIVVPTDIAIQTQGPELHFFGMTSGSAPLVTGVLADLISVLGDMSTEQAEVLLKKTSLQVPATRDHPGMNGAGQLNAYKAFKVAMRLRQRDWGSLADKFRLDLLEEPGLFNFSKEADALFSEGEQVFAGGDAERGIDRMRAGFLLSPVRSKALGLSRAYDSVGLTTNAKFYANWVRVNSY